MHQTFRKLKQSHFLSIWRTMAGKASNLYRTRTNEKHLRCWKNQGIRDGSETQFYSCILPRIGWVSRYPIHDCLKVVEGFEMKLWRWHLQMCLLSFHRGTFCCATHTLQFCWCPIFEGLWNVCLGCQLVDEGYFVACLSLFVQVPVVDRLNCTRRGSWSSLKVLPDYAAMQRLWISGVSKPKWRQGRTRPTWPAGWHSWLSAPIWRVLRTVQQSGRAVSFSVLSRCHFEFETL